VPVYAASIANAQLAGSWPAYNASQPYLVAMIIGIAGLYQLSSLKKVCLRYCESPLSFLMRRWRGGYSASLRTAFTHATYCIACCWALMVILVAAGAMSMPWVLAITLAVLAEKVLPGGSRTARVIGAALILLVIAVAARPSLAGTIRGVAPMVMEP